MNQSLFQLKPLCEWNLDYLLNLSAEEFDWIDFKRSDWLKPDGSFHDKISRYLSAWANYNGGYLVVGIDESSIRTNLAPDIGVDLNLKHGVKDWLESKLPSLVDEPLEQISVRTFPISTDSNRGIVVIHVPPSKIAPHQAIDKKFYTRLGSHLYPLSKRAILDILCRQRHPDVRVEMKLVLINPDIGEKSALICRVFNDSDVFCRHVCVDVSIPLRYKNSGLFFPDGSIDSIDGKNFWVVRMKNGINGPLFPRSDRQMRSSVKHGVSLKDDSGELISIDPILTMRTYADGAPPKETRAEFDTFVSVRPYRSPG